MIVLLLHRIQALAAILTKPHEEYVRAPCIDHAEHRHKTRTDSQVLFPWDNHADETITAIGVLKAGGQTTPKDAPDRKGWLTAMTVQDTIAGTTSTAVRKGWGDDCVGGER